MKLLRKLKPFDRQTGELNVVIDTPKGCRNKFAFDFDLKGYAEDCDAKGHALSIRS